MSFVLSVSKLMKASEVRELCKEMREQKHILAKQEAIVKALLFSRNKKAAS
ncbi:hypothetical protein [Bacillus sp. 1NLA3E]|uniref:hypothetical protein n=1 Tax=Bacillus sp. 1NLA3E TaxID=666686 RepID=UPI000247E671|nr:hypothetical protein [Bacillus sp. 1NLA3E]MDF2791330.1 hypothetical protein [Neobacillus sp.]